MPLQNPNDFGSGMSLFSARRAMVRMFLTLDGGEPPSRSADGKGQNGKKDTKAGGKRNRGAPAQEQRKNQGNQKKNRTGEKAAEGRRLSKKLASEESGNQAGSVENGHRYRQRSGVGILSFEKTKAGKQKQNKGG